MAANLAACPDYGSMIGQARTEEGVVADVCHLLRPTYISPSVKLFLTVNCSRPMDGLSRSIVEGVFMRRLESGDRERQPAGGHVRKPDPRAASGPTLQGHTAPGAARSLTEA